jgi:hypothetical protein
MWPLYHTGTARRGSYARVREAAQSGMPDAIGFAEERGLMRGDGAERRRA